jgi:hypothetical protein
MDIELLGFSGCPNTPIMRENLRAALSSMGLPLKIAEIDQEALLASDVRRGYLAPTVLVNGRDLFGMPKSSSRSIGCRIYRGGIPDAKQIATRLKTVQEHTRNSR